MQKRITFLFTILCFVESTNNPLAVGDLGEIGIVQILDPVIEDVNKIFNTEYNIEDCYDVEKSRDIFKKYLHHYGTYYEKTTGCEADYKILSRIWNGGPKGYEKESTLPYWDKVYNRILERRSIP